MRQAARAIIIHNQNLLLMKRNKFGQQYYCLPGGGIEPGEKADQTVLREVYEEASIRVANPRLAFIEDTPAPFGTQYIFICEYESGEPKILEQSIEAKLNKMGKNTFEILWVPISKFAKLPFRSHVLQQTLLVAFRDGFPAQPQVIQSRAEISYTDAQQRGK